MRRGNSIEERDSRGGLFSQELQTAVRGELESMLKAPIFSQSGRCKRFLSHVVIETLSGNSNELKERTIGINVFNRANDYETGDDSIVRVTANEVRKRLGQFYGESPGIHPIQIELPRGSYVPEFRILPSRRQEKTGPLVQGNVALNAPTTGLETKNPSLSSADSTIKEHLSAVASKATTKTSVRARWSTLMIVVAVVLTAALWGIWKATHMRKGPDLWDSFLNAKSPVLICIDTHDLHLPPPTSPENQTFVNLVLYKQIISLDDAAVVSSLASVLGKKAIPFRVVGAEQTSLADFRRQPVILIGAIDNKWTILLTQNLRYRIEVANAPGSGSSKEPIASIVDSQNSSSTAWSTDLSVPFAAWKNDYAIVARMDDSTTGVPVLIEAGLGNDGSLAASELITSGALNARLKSEESCREKANFEAVIGTEIIYTRPGPPHVLRLTCW